MVNAARDVLLRITDTWEILVIDDGSTDATVEITNRLSKDDSRVRLVSLGRNCGFGTAIRTGISEASMPWVFYTDCDGQFDLDELEIVWGRRNEADIISCYRKKRNDPFMRIVYSLGYNALTCIMFKGGFRDTDASFKLYRKEIFEVVRPQSTCGVADFEILLLAEKYGFKVVQMPVAHYPRRAGTVSFESVRSGIIAWVKISAITEMFNQLLALRIRLWRGDV